MFTGIEVYKTRQAKVRGASLLQYEIQFYNHSDTD